MALNEIKSVLITDDVNQKCVDILENNDFKVVKNTKLTVDQIKAEIKVNCFNIIFFCKVNDLFNEILTKLKELRLSSR